MRDVRACVLRIEGTNCEDETKSALDDVGIHAELVHLKQLTGDAPKERVRELLDYQVLMLPGGWSAGDYVRAGAIFAARMKSRLGDKLREFVDDGRIVCGICNGFQILIELGLLPGFDGMSEHPEAALSINKNSHFQCRPTYLRHVNKCAITQRIEEGRVMQVPVAHAEGRLTFGSRNEEYLKKLVKNRQIVFRYCMPDGSEVEGVFPWNPNGSIQDIAGISNPAGNVLGMMPHPERVVLGIQHADWTRLPRGEYGDGRLFFESIVGYIREGL